MKMFQRKSWNRVYQHQPVHTSVFLFNVGGMFKHRPCLANCAGHQIFFKNIFSESRWLQEYVRQFSANFIESVDRGDFFKVGFLFIQHPLSGRLKVHRGPDDVTRWHSGQRWHGNVDVSCLDLNQVLKVRVMSTVEKKMEFRVRKINTNKRSIIYWIYGALCHWKCDSRVRRVHSDVSPSPSSFSIFISFFSSVGGKEKIQVADAAGHRAKTFVSPPAVDFSWAVGASPPVVSLQLFCGLLPSLRTTLWPCFHSPNVSFTALIFK